MTESGRPTLPHRPPFVLLDSILEVTPGKYARAEKLVNGSDLLLRDGSSLSEILLIEAMAQCAGVAAASNHRDSTGALVAIDQFRVHGTVAAGDRLAIEAHIVKKMGAMTKARATVRVAGDLRAEAQLVLRLGILPGKQV